ncbi:MAG: hypothetical protein MI700_10435 [Balneolales bacterium]|nr:hypothetical protein [Balneolales bacterium]
MRQTIWVVLGAALLTFSCAQAIDVQQFVDSEPYGFWNGLWHGIIAPFSFFVSLFKEDVAIYAINNNGGWYDFGFVLGAGILFGGSRKGRRRKKED